MSEWGNLLLALQELPNLLLRLALGISLLVVVVAGLVTISLIIAILAAARSDPGKLGADLGRACGWLHGHLLPIVAGLILLGALGTLISGVFGTLEVLDALYLLGLMLIAACLAQYGNELLSRVTRVGPFEFAQRQIVRFEEQLERIQGEFRLQSPGLELTPEEEYLYEKAAQFITFLGFYGLERTNVASSRDFRSLLETVVRIATMNKKDDYRRATEWLEMLISIADDETELRDAHYRAGVAFHRWAKAADGVVRESLFEKAIPHHNKVIALDPDDHRAYFHAAYAQDELGRYGLAIKNNEKVLGILPLAKAKYNIAISHINLGDLQAAFKQLDGIKLSDHDVAGVVTTARSDEELAPLRDHPDWADRVRNILDDLSRA